MLAWFAAAVSLWLGARRRDGAAGRAYRWMAGGAVLYGAGLIIDQFSTSANPAPGLSFADLPSLIALACVAVGIGMLTTAERPATALPTGPSRPRRDRRPRTAPIPPARSCPAWPTVT